MFKPEELSALSNAELIKHVKAINQSIHSIKNRSAVMLDGAYAQQRIQHKKDIIAGIGIELERRRGTG